MFVCTTCKEVLISKKHDKDLLLTTLVCTDCEKEEIQVYDPEMKIFMSHSGSKE